MGEEDPKPPDDPTSFPLPPGSRFYPSEQELVCYYLTSKNNGTNYYGTDVIKELDLYNFAPFKLPEADCFRFGSGGRRQHWYCYVRRVVLRERGRRTVAGGGYWKKRGRVRDVVDAGAGKVVVGTRKSFDFYSGDSPENTVRPRWVLYEYALIHRHVGSFVLCRVFNKPHLGHNLSEHIISSCGEESVATVRHIGVQYDGNVRSIIGESKMHDESMQNDDNEVLKLPTGQGNELDETSPKPDSEQDLKTILEGDYIELDDLLRPLAGVD